ncbi:hypothetical protein KSS87_016948, partial [Heliosperma pusillum]
MFLTWKYRYNETVEMQFEQNGRKRELVISENKGLDDSSKVFLVLRTG